MLRCLSLDDLNRLEDDLSEVIECIKFKIENDIDHFGANYTLRLVSYEARLQAVVDEKSKRVSNMNTNTSGYTPDGDCDYDNLPF